MKRIISCSLWALWQTMPWLSKMGDIFKSNPHVLNTCKQYVSDHQTVSGSQRTVFTRGASRLFSLHRSKTFSFLPKSPFQRPHSGKKFQTILSFFLPECLKLHANPSCMNIPSLQRKAQALSLPAGDPTQSITS